jgi:hypothetical protein
MCKAFRVFALFAAPFCGIPGAEAGTIIMPSGSTVWMETNSSPTGGGGCWDGVTALADDCIGSNKPGPNPANGIPTTSFVGNGNTVTTSAEVLPNQIRGFLSGRVSELNISFQDTYTIHGALADPFNITVQLNATGTMSGLDGGPLVNPAFRYFMAGTTVTAKIGTFNPDSTTDLIENQRVSAFLGASDFEFGPTLASSSPFSTPFDVTASYVLAGLAAGGSFTLGYGITLHASVGVIDMLNTAHISFILPEGVFLTSALGGRFGEEAVSEVPLPAALPLFAIGLGLMGLFGWRRRRAHA